MIIDIFETFNEQFKPFINAIEAKQFTNYTDLFCWQVETLEAMEYKIYSGDDKFGIIVPIEDVNYDAYSISIKGITGLPEPVFSYMIHVLAFLYQKGLIFWWENIGSQFSDPLVESADEFFTEYFQINDSEHTNDDEFSKDEYENLMFEVKNIYANPDSDACKIERLIKKIGSVTTENLYSKRTIANDRYCGKIGWLARQCSDVSLENYSHRYDMDEGVDFREMMRVDWDYDNVTQHIVDRTSDYENNFGMNPPGRIVVPGDKLKSGFKSDINILTSILETIEDAISENYRLRQTIKRIDGHSRNNKDLQSSILRYSNCEEIKDIGISTFKEANAEKDYVED